MVCSMDQRMFILYANLLDGIDKFVIPFRGIILNFGDIKASDHPVEAAPVEHITLHLQISDILNKAFREAAKLWFALPYIPKGNTACCPRSHGISLHGYRVELLLVLYKSPMWLLLKETVCFRVLRSYNLTVPSLLEVASKLSLASNLFSLLVWLVLTVSTLFRVRSSN